MFLICAFSCLFLCFLMPLTVLSFITVSPYAEAIDFIYLFIYFLLPIEVYAVKELMPSCLLLKNTLSP